MKKLLLSLSLSVAALFSAAAADQFVKVTDASTLKAGDEIIVVNVAKSVALSAQNGNFRDKVDVIIDNDAILVDSEPVTVITLEESDNTEYPWLFNTADGYLYSGSTTKNTCMTTNNKEETGASISITISDGKTSVKCNNTSRSILSYNNSYPRFAFYGSLQSSGDVTIFAKLAEVTVDPIEYDALPSEVTLMEGENKMLADKYPTNILFESSDESVVTVSEKGMLTAIAAGKATITAIWGGDNVYTKGKVEIAVTVTEYVQTTNVTFDFVKNYAAYGLEPSTTNTITREASVEVSGITLNLTGKWVLWKNDKTLRCYKADTKNAAANMEFIAPEGYEIVKISANASLKNFNYNSEACGAEWEGKAALVELETITSTNFKTITVTLQEIGGAGDDPVVEPLEYDIVILDSKGETLSGVIGSHDLDSVESFTIYFSQNNAEGISFYYMLEANTEEPEVETLAAEPAEGYTLYNNEDGIVIPNNYNGTLSYYAQDDATEAKTDIKTISIDPNQNTSGISAVEIDAANGAVEYFNLQGVRVNAPATGLYLMRQGDKVMKVVIR